jgi:lipopolysaccharide export system permease protein
MKGRSSAVNLAGSGLWLRQDVDTGYAILHARTVNPANARFGEVTVFYFDDNSQPQKRIDGRSARLIDGFWEIQDGWINRRDMAADPMDVHRLPTDLTFAEIEDSFAAPQTISIYRLPNFIQTMEKTGFSALRLKSYFYELLAMPVLFIGLTLLGTIIAYQSPRRAGGWRLIGGGVIVAFVLFFFGDVLQALGLADALPLMVAAWATSILSVLIGTVGLLYLEDG